MLPTCWRKRRNPPKATEGGLQLAPIMPRSRRKYGYFASWQRWLGLRGVPILAARRTVPGMAGRARRIRQAIATGAMCSGGQWDAVAHHLPGPEQVETRRWGCPTNNSSPPRKPGAQG
ncbi:hypothetical protein CNECB9_950002 [Cupriavidus necator]|uniref:Uncharacterized protein n=1 Tax=Cupriavidus necator TaxID=106590 RepID=A0A1K0K0B1_CUPNE|nr:hypothetical protein CNECB9_950002 [Cupriavidus necator]